MKKSTQSFATCTRRSLITFIESNSGAKPFVATIGAREARCAVPVMLNVAAILHCKAQMSFD